MAVSSSSTSQTSTSILPSSCSCRRCGDVIAACNLVPRPSSCDPPFQKTTSEWTLRQATNNLYRTPVLEELRNSKRIQEETLHRLWDSIDLSEPDRPVWWPFLPRWVRHDDVACQIAGLASRKRNKQETYAQEWERLGREFEEREKLRPKSPSPSERSIFTDSEDDALPVDALQSPVDRMSSQQFCTNNRNKNQSGFSFSSPVLLDSVENSRKAPINSVTEPAPRHQRKLRGVNGLKILETGLSQQRGSSGSQSPSPGGLDRSIRMKTSPANSSSSLASQLSPESLLQKATYLCEDEKSSLATSHVIKTSEPASLLPHCAISPCPKSIASGLTANPFSGHGLATPVSLRRGDNQLDDAINHEREEQSHGNSPNHASIGKRRRDGSILSLSGSQSPREVSLIRSIRPRKRLRTR